MNSIRKILLAGGLALTMLLGAAATSNAQSFSFTVRSDDRGYYNDRYYYPAPRRYYRPAPRYYYPAPRYYYRDRSEWREDRRHHRRHHRHHREW